MTPGFGRGLGSLFQVPDLVGILFQVVKFLGRELSQKSGFGNGAEIPVGFQRDTVQIGMKFLLLEERVIFVAF